MVSSPSSYALFSVQTKNPDVTSSLRGLRGIVKRSDIPANSFDGSKTNKQVLNRAWVPCNKPSAFKHGVDHGNPFTYPYPNFASGETYMGSVAAGKCQRKYGSMGQYRTDCGLGDGMNNYIYPRDATAFPRLVSLSISSTGIGGGGIVRSLFSMPSGSLATSRRDEIAYVDPNVQCTHHRVVKWELLSVGKITGWLPRRNADLPATAASGDPYGAYDPTVRNSSNSNCPTNPIP
jgi:hypothetical protein